MVRKSAKYRLLGSRSDVTVVTRPLIFETRSRAKMAAILVRFSVLQRGIKIQGFDQIQNFFRRNSHQSMTMFFRRKKKIGVRCLLNITMLDYVLRTIQYTVRTTAESTSTTSFYNFFFLLLLSLFCVWGNNESANWYDCFASCHGSSFYFSPPSPLGSRFISFLGSLNIDQLKIAERVLCLEKATNSTYRKKENGLKYVIKFSA